MALLGGKADVLPSAPRAGHLEFYYLNVQLTVSVNKWLEKEICSSPRLTTTVFGSELLICLAFG